MRQRRAEGGLENRLTDWGVITPAQYLALEESGSLNDKDGREGGEGC